MATQLLSDSAQTEDFQFSVYASGPLADFARLTLFDGHMQVIADEYAAVTCRVPKGLYKLTLKINEAYDEQLLIVEQDIHRSIPTPKTASSTFAEGFSTTHEYYSEYAKAISLRPTAALPDKQGKGALFLFFRYPDSSTFSNFRLPGFRLADHFQLLDADRLTISSFAESEVREEMTTYGWMGFHVSLNLVFITYTTVAGR